MAITCRVVAGPTSFSDDTEHRVTLTDTVARGETLVAFVGCSVTTIQGIVGYFDADDGLLVPNQYTSTWMSWDFIEEFGGAAGGGYNGVSCFSSYMPNGLTSGTTIRFGVKWGTTGAPYDASGFYHGQSPWCVVVALNSGDGSFMVYDTSDSTNHNTTTTPTSPSIVTSANAVTLGFFAGTTTAGAGWFTAGSGFTELADTAQGTESNFNIALEYRVDTGGYSGTASGTSSVSGSFGIIVAAFKSTTVEPAKVPVMLAGSRAGGTTTDFFSNGNTAAWPFTAVRSGRSLRMFGRFGIDNSGVTTARLGIYSHDSVNNRPLHLLGSGDVGSSPNPINLVPFGAPVVGVNVIIGTQYWLAFSGAGEQVDIRGLSSAASGREGTGNMVKTWVASGNMGVIPSIWIEGLEFVGNIVTAPDRMPQGV